MALISYYNQPVESNRIDINDSPYTKAHTFELTVTTCEEDKIALANFLDGRTTITGIIEEIPRIEYSTSWGDSPVATINKKIQEFTQNKWIKMFAQQNEDYRPPLITDDWTQQFPKAAEPLSISFKFRSYPIDGYYNTTLFSDIIKLLIFVSTPQEFNLSNTMDYMAKSWRQSYKKGQEGGKLVNKLTEQLSKSDVDFSSQIFTETKEDFLHYVDSLGDMGLDNVGGCPLIEIGINDLIKKDSTIKWLLKSWSFKPALQVTFDNNPIYVDFNISLQTQYVLSNKDLARILL